MRSWRASGATDSRRPRADSRSTRRRGGSACSCATSPPRRPIARSSRRVPRVKAGLGADGTPSQALLGFAKKQGVAVEKLERIHDGKQEVFAFRSVATGARLETTAGGARRWRAQEAADPEDDALGRPRRGVRPAGARPRHAARRAGRAGHRARAVERPHDARPPLPGQGHDRDCTRRRLRSTPRARRQGDRELRAARAQDPRRSSPPRPAARRSPRRMRSTTK